MEAKFTISEVFKTSWQALKSQIWVLVGLYIGYVILAMIINLLITPQLTSVIGITISYAIGLLLVSIFSLGYIKNMFQTLDGEEPQFSAYGQQASKVLTYLVAYVLFMIIISIGLLLVVLPGIYLILRLQFFGAFIVEENAGIIDCFKKSWAITKGQGMNLFILFLTMLGIGIVGVLLLIVGWFIAFPLINIMQCYVFRKLNIPFQAIEEE